MLGNFRATNHAVGIARQEFKERIFLGCKRNRTISALGRLRPGIELQIAHENLCGAQLSGTAQQCTQARQQFAELKWLRQIIIGARVQSLDAIVDGIPRREHQDGHALFAGSDRTASSEAILTWNHHVQDHYIVVVDLHLIESIVAIGNDVDSVGLFLKSTDHEACDTRIVFDKQESHTRIIRQFIKEISMIKKLVATALSLGLIGTSLSSPVRANDYVAIRPFGDSARYVRH